MKGLFLAIIIFSSVFVVNNLSYSYSQLDLMKAIKEGKLKRVNQILKSNMSLNFLYNQRPYQNETPLKLAVKTNYHEMVDFFLKKGADVNQEDQNGATALCFVHDLKMAKLLISRGGKINISLDKGVLKGWTPLHFAVSKNQMKITRYLIEKGANPISKSSWGETPLHIAVSVGNVELFKILYSNRVKTFLRGRHGLSLLHLATSVSMAKLLKSYGLSLKTRNHNKRLPIHLAAKLGELNLVKYFIQAGSPLNKKDINGKTPLDLTYSRKVARLLKKAGGKNSKKK